MPTPPGIAGIDVGKSELDAHVEPTGLYHRDMHQGLLDAGLETVLTNPLYARRFNQALVRHAKNDRGDAAMLARYGQLNGLRSTSLAPSNLRQLSDLLALRRKLVAHRDAVRKLRAALDFGQLDASFDDACEAEIRRLDAAFQAYIEADETLSRRPATIHSVPGFGPLNATSVCAVRHHDASRALYRRLLAKGRQRKVALVAFMRQLLTFVYALLRDDRQRQAQAPGRATAL